MASMPTRNPNQECFFNFMKASREHDWLSAVFAAWDYVVRRDIWDVSDDEMLDGIESDVPDDDGTENLVYKVCNPDQDHVCAKSKHEFTVAYWIQN